MTRSLFAAAIALASAGCLQTAYNPPPCNRPDMTGCIIEGVHVTGNKAVSESDILPKLATTESSHPVLGALEGIPVLSLWDRLGVEYERLDPFILERDLQRVERIYRARGYYDAHARAARVFKGPKGRVRVEIVVDEGVPVRVAKVGIVWKGKPGGGGRDGGRGSRRPRRRRWRPRTRTCRRWRWASPSSRTRSRT